MKNLTKKEIKILGKENTKKFEIVLILENIQYASNVAGIFRTADAAGVSKILLTGFSKTPPFGKDLQKASRKKEKVVAWEYFESTEKAIKQLRNSGFEICVLELTDESKPIKSFVVNFTGDKIALIAGNEVSGVMKNTLQNVDNSVYIPMYGKGSSLNVGTSIAVFIYSLVIFNTK